MTRFYVRDLWPRLKMLGSVSRATAFRIQKFLYLKRSHRILTITSTVMDAIEVSTSGLKGPVVFIKKDK